MKMAVQYWINRGDAAADKFVAFKGGYHGDTTGAMAVSDPDEGMHALFRGLLPEHLIVDLPAMTRTRSARFDSLLRAACAKRSQASLSSRWCRARAG